MSHHNLGPGRCDWRTPDWILERVRKVFGGSIRLDPATSPDNPTGAEIFYTQDGLEFPWGTDGLFVNPPWSKELGMPVSWWAAKFWDTHEDDDEMEMIGLFPASVNSQWFHDYIWPATICFPRGRVAYGPPPGHVESSAPTFDTAIAYYGQGPLTFGRAFEDRGVIRYPE